MLEMNDEIRKAYQLKELFYEYVPTQLNKEKAEIALKEWIRRAKLFSQKEWYFCIRAFKNWFDEITNSFNYPWTNGYVEGSHNKIKVIKRTSYGYNNFHHFRIKILLAFS